MPSLSLVPRKLPPLWSAEVNEPGGNYFWEADHRWEYKSWSEFLQGEPWNRNALYGNSPIFWYWWTQENDYDWDDGESELCLDDELWIVYPAFGSRVIVCLINVQRDEEPEIREWLTAEFAPNSYLWGLGLVDQSDSMSAAVSKYLKTVEDLLLQVLSDKQICERILAFVETDLEIKSFPF